MRAVLAIAPIVAAVIAVVAFAAFAGRGPRPALASFHLVRIYGVMGGAGGSVADQFVEIREAAPGQDQVQNAQLCFYDSAGVPWARFVFPDSVPGGDKDGSVLVASVAMAADWNAGGGAQPDFIFGAANTTALNNAANVNAPVPVPAGAIVYESAFGDPNCGSPLSPIDSIAYGTGYTGAAFFGSAFSHDLPTDGGGFQLKSTPVSFPPSNNSTEYAAVDCIVARNNNGDSGTVGGGNCATPSPTPSPTPTTTPTATPTQAPTAIQGDADCDGGVDVDDGIAVLKDFSGLGAVACPDRADVNCDAAGGPADTLQIVRYLAGLPSSADNCTPIGQPLLS